MSSPNHLDLSLLERYLAKTTLPILDNLNSKSPERITSKTSLQLSLEEQKKKFPIKKFQHKVGSLDIPFEIILVHLEDIYEQDTYEWMLYTRKKLQEMEISEENEKAILSKIIDSGIKTDINFTQKKSDSILDSIARLQADSTVSNKLISDLRYILQENHYIIRNYAKEIKECVDKISFINHYSKEKHDFLLKTTFFNNLGVNTKIFLEEKKINDLKESITELNRMEKIIHTNLPTKNIQKLNQNVTNSKKLEHNLTKTETLRLPQNNCSQQFRMYSSKTYSQRKTKGSPTKITNKRNKNTASRI